MFIYNRFTGELILKFDDHAEIKQSGVSLFGADLIRANLSGADLSEVDLRRACFRRANLGCANLSGANLSYADLQDTNLTYADLRAADLRGADLRDADIDGAKLPDNFFYLRAYPYNIWGTAECVWIGCEKLVVTNNLRADLLRLKEKHEIDDATADRLIPLIESLINSVKGK